MDRKLALLLLLFACDKPPPPSTPAEHVRGSHVVGSICFQRSTPDGWWEVGLVLEDGGMPVRESAFHVAYLPVDAGVLRVVSCE